MKRLVLVGWTKINKELEYRVYLCVEESHLAKASRSLAKISEKEPTVMNGNYEMSLY